jgi:excisionase family DNA binding protein
LKYRITENESEIIILSHGMSNKELSLKEASKLTGYHPDYISYLIRNKKINGEKIGRNWFVSKDELLTYLSTKKYSSATALFKKSTLALVSMVVFLVIAVSFYFLSGTDPEASVIIQNIRDEAEPIVVQ